MEGLGFLLLDRITLFEIVVMMIPGITVGISQGFHGDDGLSTTQLLLVFDGDVGRFGESSRSSIPGFVAFAISTTRCRGVYEVVSTVNE